MPFTEIVTITGAGSEMTVEFVDKQLLLSLTVMLCNPAHILSNVLEFWKLFPSIEYVYGAKPPLTELIMVPSQSSKQLTCIEDNVITNSDGSLIISEIEFSHPLASLTVKLFKPGERLLKIFEFWNDRPLLFEYSNGGVPPEI